MNKEIVSIKNLSFKYNEEDNELVLNNINVNVHKGEWISIVGHNGSGKSTLAKFLIGLLTPEQENIIKIVGYDTFFDDHIWEVRKNVGMVFQNPDNQMVATNVQDDIAFGLENCGVSRVEMLERISWAISKVKMDKLINYEPHRLSGGQKQRVAIAGILAMRPSVIILDEATSMLDPIGRQEVMNTVKQLNKEENITIINITHDLEETVLSDRMIVLNRGTIVKQGSPEEVFQDHSMIEEAGLELPFSLQLQNLLIDNGYTMNTPTLTKEALVDELWKLKLQT